VHVPTLFSRSLLRTSEQYLSDGDTRIERPDVGFQVQQELYAYNATFAIMSAVSFHFGPNPHQDPNSQDKLDPDMNEAPYKDKLQRPNAIKNCVIFKIFISTKVFFYEIVEDVGL
jgi:hypothetical protein